MKIIIGIIICLVITLAMFALARSAGLSDRRLEEIQRKTTGEAGDPDGN